MHHSVDELIAVARRYYRQDTCFNDAYQETEEERRLIAARIHAGTGENRTRWHAFLDRIREQFPAYGLQNRSIALQTGSGDASYHAEIYLPLAEGEHSHSLRFQISFVVPYYIIYSDRLVDDPEARKAYHASNTSSTVVGVLVGETWTFIPAEEVDPEFHAKEAKRFRRSVMSFDFSPEEAPIAAWLAREIEATFGVERMPPEIGKVLVPEVSMRGRLPGEATLYDCLFSDQ
jgi:hypothetical protein